MKMPDDQSAFWDEAAKSKEFAHPLDGARFLRAVPLDTPVLDYGCGHGRLCNELSRLGYADTRGVDYSSEMIRVARSRYPGRRFSVVDGRTLPYPAGSFGAVLLVAVLTCIPSDDHQRMLLAEISRVLRPGGLLLVSDYPLQSDERNRRRYEANLAEYGCYGTFRLVNGGVVRHHPMARFEALLAGYAIENVAHIDAKTMNGNPARIVQFWARRAA